MFFSLLAPTEWYLLLPFEVIEVFFQIAIMASLLRIGHMCAVILWNVLDVFPA